MRGGRAGDQSRARTHKLRLFGNRWLMSENWVRGTGRPPCRGNHSADLGVEFDDGSRSLVESDDGSRSLQEMRLADG